MGTGFLVQRGGSGGGLNFRVLGGTSKPSNFKENDIWVNTNIKITSWVFSTTEPVVTADDYGMVWISTDISSNKEFNALKKNGIQVYPLVVNQYVGGTWMGVTAMIYQNGEWSNLVSDQYLYDAGDEFTNVTGGLKAYAIPYASSGSYSEGMSPIITRNTSSITIKHNSSYTDKSGIVRFANKIDLSKYRTLKFDGTLSGARASIYIWNSIGSYYGQNYVAYKTGSASGEISVDIPAGTGECYIGFGIDHTQTITLKKMWLEG